jgi:hypothetical protein
MRQHRFRFTLDHHRDERCKITSSRIVLGTVKAGSPHDVGRSFIISLFVSALLMFGRNGDLTSSNFISLVETDKPKVERADHVSNIPLQSGLNHPSTNVDSLPRIRAESDGRDGSFHLRQQLQQHLSKPENSTLRLIDGPTTRRQRGLPPRVLFHHAHKTGGTSVCTMAINNGEITLTDHGIHPIDGDPVCYYQTVPYCRKDLNHLMKLNSTVTYVDFHCSAHPSWRIDMNHDTATVGDHATQGNHSGRDWMYVTFLRHPLERLLSEYRHYGVDRVFIPASWNKTNLTTDEKRNDVELFMMYARDKNRINFYRRFYIPHCSSNVLLECAKKFLKKYDVLVILEQFREDCPRFAHALGWNARLACSTHKNAGAGRLTNAFAYLGEDKANELLRLNAMDLEIYNIAAELVEDQKRVWQRRRTGESI